MSEHTPLPWFAVNRGTDEEPMWSVMAARIAGRDPGHEVALCATGDSPQAMETANAAFIVRAVNAHDELTDLLSEIRQWMDEDMCGPWDAKFTAKIDAALAKAKQP